MTRIAPIMPQSLGDYIRTAPVDAFLPNSRITPQFDRGANRVTLGGERLADNRENNNDKNAPRRRTREK